MQTAPVAVNVEVSTHASVRRRLLRAARHCNATGSFNSRLREEATVAERLDDITDEVSTHASVRRRPLIVSLFPRWEIVSTHASVRRRQADEQRCNVAGWVSTHASVRRRRLRAGSVGQARRSFNSRLREEATRHHPR